MARNVELCMETLQRTMELEADSNTSTNRIRCFEIAHARAARNNEALHRELATTRAELELRARQTVYESRLLDMEC